MAWWLAATLILALIPSAVAEASCASLAPASTCAAATLPNGTDTNATNVSTTTALAATSVTASASPYGVFVVAQGELISSVTGIGVYAVPQGAPEDWACIFYEAAGGASCQTADQVLAALGVDAGSYQNLIIDATKMVSCDVRARVCQLPLG